MRIANFTPAPAFEGGCLLALAALIFLVVANKRTGISGLLGAGLLRALKAEPLDRVASTFVGAFLLGSLAAQQYLFPASSPNQKNAPPAAPFALPAYVLSGLLVGFGTRLGNGCTSGHGVCGLTRLSKRGFAAVGTFMAVGIAVATLLGECPGGNPLLLRAEGVGGPWDTPLDAWPALQRRTGSQQQQPWTLGVAALAGLLLLWDLPRKLRGTPLVHASAAAAGALFAAGLQRSGMAQQEKVLGFLYFLSKDGWDPSLVVVLGAAVGLLLLPTVWVLGHMEHALGDRTAKIHAGKTAWAASQAEMVDARLVVGEAIFGLGWGMTGLCPGPALCLFAAGAPRIVLAFFPAYLAGWLLVDVVDKAKKSGKKAA